MAIVTAQIIDYHKCRLAGDSKMPVHKVITKVSWDLVLASIF